MLLPLDAQLSTCRRRSAACTRFPTRTIRTYPKPYGSDGCEGIHESVTDHPDYDMICYPRPTIMSPSLTLSGIVTVIHILFGVSAKVAESGVLGKLVPVHVRAPAHQHFNPCVALRGGRCSQIWTASLPSGFSMAEH